MRSVKIYEVKKDSASNAEILLSPENPPKHFYWNDAKFKHDEPGDVVFVVNKTAKWALYTVFREGSIETTQKNNTTSFLHNKNSYTVQDPEGIYDKFICLEIKSKVELPIDWNWTRQIGQSETYLLWNKKIDKQEKRLEKVEDLLKVFTEGEANEMLLKAKELLGGSQELIPEIVDAIQADEIQELINADDFWSEKLLEEWEAFKSINFTKKIYRAVNELISEKTSFDHVLSTLGKETNEFRVLDQIGRLVAYIDRHGANKEYYNEYEDKRVMASAGVRQTNWVQNLLQYKIDGNSFDSITSESIKNTIDYLEDPTAGATMLAESHRKLAYKHLFKMNYHHSTFVDELRFFFKPYGITVNNKQNETRVYCNVLYHPKVKPLWDDRIEGLVASDPGDWFDSRIEDLESNTYTIVWWNKTPSGTSNTLKLLRDQLQNEGFFYFYYAHDNKVHHRARVVDFAQESDYPDKNWNLNGDVGMFCEEFSGYTDSGVDAKIVFLIDEMVKIESNLKISDFTYYKDYQPPTRNNIQPFESLNIDLGSISVSSIKNVKDCHFQHLIRKANDGTNWIEDFIKDFKSRDYDILYSSFLPSCYGNDIYFGLEKKLKEKGHFYIYYEEEGSIKYKAKVIDCCNRENAEAKLQSFNKYLKPIDQVDNIDSLTPITEGFPTQIIYLISELEKLSQPIIIDDLDILTSGKMEEGKCYAMRFRRNSSTILAKDLIRHFVEYTGSKGFIYNYEEAANFYLSLRAKPFVILAGISGTGKTQLPRQFLKSIGYENNIIQVAVRPDWTDGSDLLGYVDLNNTFQPKDLVSAIKRALLAPNEPFFFILDEMNLARVEYYFSDFLSVIETRERNNKTGAVLTDPLIKPESIANASNRSEYGNISWPDNLYLIGTVNMDETTHPFSKKVLDRANSIEMNTVDLSWQNGSDEELHPIEGAYNDLWKTPFIGSNELSQIEKQSVETEINFLKEINEILQQGELHFAYRVRDEVAFYLVLNKRFELLEKSVALDFQMVQKILPRIHGSSDRVLKILVELLNLFENLNLNHESSKLVKDILDKTANVQFKYPRSSKKLMLMINRFEQDRFTSFWL